jgi:hypothetical protein
LITLSNAWLVTAALAVATNRHINLQEEKQQFDEASTGVVGHLAAEVQLFACY